MVMEKAKIVAKVMAMTMGREKGREKAMATVIIKVVVDLMALTDQMDRMDEMTIRAGKMMASCGIVATLIGNVQP
jgi:hypothetical protein